MNKEEVLTLESLNRLTYPFTPIFYEQFHDVPQRYAKRLQWWPLTKFIRLVYFVFFFGNAFVILVICWLYVLTYYIEVLPADIYEVKSGPYMAVAALVTAFSIFLILPLIIFVKFLAHCSSDQALVYVLRHIVH